MIILLKDKISLDDLSYALKDVTKELHRQGLRDCSHLELSFKAYPKDTHEMVRIFNKERLEVIGYEVTQGRKGQFSVEEITTHARLERLQVFPEGTEGNTAQFYAFLNAIGIAAALVFSMLLIIGYMMSDYLWE